MSIAAGAGGTGSRGGALLRKDGFRVEETITLMDDGEKHISTTEARAGSTPHMTRYVLTIGLGLVVVLFALILLVQA